MVPKTTIGVEDEAQAKKILRLIDALEENDDVQEVYANFDIPERVLEEVAAPNGTVRSQTPAIPSERPVRDVRRRAYCLRVKVSSESTQVRLLAGTGSSTKATGASGRWTTAGGRPPPARRLRSA